MKKILLAALALSLPALSCLAADKPLPKAGHILCHGTISAKKENTVISVDRDAAGNKCEKARREFEKDNKLAAGLARPAPGRMTKWFYAGRGYDQAYSYNEKGDRFAHEVSGDCGIEVSIVPTAGEVINKNFGGADVVSVFPHGLPLIEAKFAAGDREPLNFCRNFQLQDLTFVEGVFLNEQGKVDYSLLVKINFIDAAGNSKIASTRFKNNEPSQPIFRFSDDEGSYIR